ncbi:Membrane protein implicated in regulation of membrane protease activity [Sulfurivirga caldicuralii]|uniref:Membrane protein implicated in regulation of membrane protease activity n=1 Tax=Sulfurivirga caldicuralii TaxID=364032 RepID=A0A1N6DQQ0_9GAMM|nr:hypothetical protein [Sulfurivirga caldicuralii]SIN73132.1 Membrane protein implicated in regulation of membrane protease activity [Sulfurivirga caldicuralii]
MSEADTLQQLHGYVPLFSIWWMLLIGTALIVIEVLAGLGSFVVLWFGIATIVVGFLGLFMDFRSGEFQLIAVAIFGTVLLLAFRRPLMRWMASREAPPPERYEAGGIGELQQHDGRWSVYYRGTWWRLQNRLPAMDDGMQVRVVHLHESGAMIEPLDEAAGEDQAPKA